ncbi:MAG: trans-sulfuration enzyme family protein [Actinomycetota bacterium]
MARKQPERSTLAVSAGRPAEQPGGPVIQPPVLSSVYQEGGDYLYSRDGNPIWAAFEETLGALEGGRATVFSSGMAAVSAVVNALCPLGSKLVIQREIYYGSLELFESLQEKRRVTIQTIGFDPEEAVGAAAGARLVWLESPANPLLSIVDISGLASAAHDAGALVVVDNTFATPMLQQPLDLGADMVVHSVTKFIAGHSDLVMGAAVTRNEAHRHAMRKERTTGGAVPGPLETFLALRGLRTLPVRIEKGQANSLELAGRLEEHPRVRRVYYPGLTSHPGHELARKQMDGPGAMLAFEVDGDAEAADRACAAVTIIRHATSLGGVESSMERRARWAGEKSAPPSLIRMSVGCEDVEDLWDDLSQALETALP